MFERRNQRESIEAFFASDVIDGRCCEACISPFLHVKVGSFVSYLMTHIGRFLRHDISYTGDCIPPEFITILKYEC